MRAGAIDGLSIGFEAVRARARSQDRLRRLAEIDLWEISVVTFPMLRRACRQREASPVGGALPTNDNSNAGSRRTLGSRVHRPAR